MKVPFDASPEDVIAESIRRKIRTMNVSAEQQQKCVTMHVTSYVLKVCGCEEFLLGNHPISQYKVFLHISFPVCFYNNTVCYHFTFAISGLQEWHLASV